jgi:hypothetical protein
VFTGGRVQAAVGQHKALDRFAADDVRFDDFVDVGLGDVSIPHGIWIDHEVRAVLTLVETARLVGPNFTFEAPFGQLLLEQFLQFRLAGGIAASPRISWRALVATYEDVLLKLWHGVILVQRRGLRYGPLFQRL